MAKTTEFKEQGMLEEQQLPEEWIAMFEKFVVPICYSCRNDVDSWVYMNLEFREINRAGNTNPRHISVVKGIQKPGT